MKLSISPWKTAAVAAALLLGGCGPSPILRFNTQVLNLGVGLDKNMVGVNYIGFVTNDEGYAGITHRLTKNVFYMAGVEERTPEYRYRIARISIRQLQGLLYISPGQYEFRTAAMIPDGMETIKSGDYVEIRQTGTWDVLKNFSKTGEGNAVLRILCKWGDPDYEKCLDALPRIGKYRAQGLTGTPYPDSLKSYGFTFSPAYTEKGELINPWPVGSRPLF